MLLFKNQKGLKNMTKYNSEIEEKMQLYFSQLSEKDKRHYAALEVKRLGHGGRKYIGTLFSISLPMLDRGLKELQNPKLYEQIPIGKQRRIGGGRKKKKLANQN